MTSRSILIRSPLSVAAAEHELGVALQPRSMFTTLTHVSGYVGNGSVQAKLWRSPGGNRTRPVVSARLEPAGSGCVLRGQFRADAAAAKAVLIAFAAIVTLVLASGLIGVVHGLVIHDRAAALNWLPAVLVPLAMTFAAAAVLAINSRLAHRDEAYFRQWLTTQLRAQPTSE